VVGHSLTSNSNVGEWWGEILGDGAGFSLDSSSDYVVCCNYLGSPYGGGRNKLNPVDTHSSKPPGSTVTLLPRSEKLVSQK
jgi:homoserine acetyltransferase